jgi:septal ring factor EnvC (AmiA/AmiB activator)
MRVVKMVYEMDEGQEIKILEKRLVVLKAEIQELQAIRKEQAEDIQELEAELAEVTKDRDLWRETEAACNEQYNILSVEHEKLEAENQRLKEALEGIISCAENVRVTYADSNQLIIDMARQALQEAGDE